MYEKLWKYVKMCENMWVLYVYEYIVCNAYDDYSALHDMEMYGKIWKCMKNIGMKMYENMWVLYVYEYIVCDEHDDCSALQSGRVLPPLLFSAIICLPVQIIQLKCSSCWGDEKQFWCIMIKKPSHRPRSEIKYQQTNDWSLLLGAIVLIGMKYEL